MQEIFEVFIDRKRHFLMCDATEANNLVNEMNRRNMALQPLRDAGKKTTPDGLLTAKRFWTFRKAFIWSSAKEIIDNCPLNTEPVVE